MPPCEVHEGLVILPAGLVSGRGASVGAGFREGDPVDVAEQGTDLPAGAELDEPEPPAALRQPCSDRPAQVGRRVDPDMVGQPFRDDSGGLLHECFGASGSRRPRRRHDRLMRTSTASTRA